MRKTNEAVLLRVEGKKGLKDHATGTGTWGRRGVLEREKGGEKQSIVSGSGTCGKKSSSHGELPSFDLAQRTDNRQYRLNKKKKARRGGSRISSLRKRNKKGIIQSTIPSKTAEHKNSKRMGGKAVWEKGSLNAEVGGEQRGGREMDRKGIRWYWNLRGKAMGEKRWRKGKGLQTKKEGGERYNRPRAPMWGETYPETRKVLRVTN